MSIRLIRMMQRRGSDAAWRSANPVLLNGEIGIVDDAALLVVGNGVNNYTDLVSMVDRAYLSSQGVTILIDGALIGLNAAIAALDAAKVNVSDIYNDLNSEATDIPLSAAMGKILADSFNTFSGDIGGAITTINGEIDSLWDETAALGTNKIDISAIINNLTSAITNQPLSAAQGKVLKDLVDSYSDPYQIVQYPFNYLDSTTVYVSGSSNLPVAAFPERIAIQVRRNERIDEVDIRWQSSAVAGSNEAVSMYLHCSQGGVITDYLIATISNTDASKQFYNTAMNGGAGIILAPNDWWVPKIVTPAWGTNPTQTHLQGIVKRRIL